VAKIELTGDFPIVQGNKAALIECVTQLLSNAVKFVAPGVSPTVRVWTDSREGKTTLYFEDNGIGIPKQAQARVFEVFQRLNKELPGSGIGLTIVKKAIERMGGKVGLQSEPGHGSLFWVELKSVMPR
jgi:signal transduction histidine kinase